MNQTPNGTGLIISETDSEGTETFLMSPELFNDSYLASLLVFSRDVDDQTLGNTRYLSFVSENPHTIAKRGLVTVIVRTADGSDFPTTQEEPTMQYQPSHDAIVTADDIRADRNAYNAEAAADGHEYDPECSCDSCEQAYADAQGNDDFTTNPVLEDLPFLEVDVAPEDHAELISRTTSTCYWSDMLQQYVPLLDADTDTRADAADTLHDRPRPQWNPRLAARAAAIVSAAGGLALAFACLTGTPSSANEQYHTGQSVVISGSNCQVTHAWEDGSAVAHCRNHKTWVFDPDGSNVHQPQTWYRVKHTHYGNGYGR